MPPAPSGPRISYGPKRVPDGTGMKERRIIAPPARHRSGLRLELGAELERLWRVVRIDPDLVAAAWRDVHPGVNLAQHRGRVEVLPVDQHVEFAGAIPRQHQIEHAGGWCCEEDSLTECACIPPNGVAWIAAYGSPQSRAWNQNEQRR